MKRLIAVLAAGLILIIGSTAWADAPKLINFQGRLADGSGNPVADGSYSVTFRIYNVTVGGAALWSEIQTVSTTDGIFNVLLGSATALPVSVFDDTTRYLGVEVSPDPEMTPRQRLGSVGYSFASNPWGSSGNNIFKLNGNVGIGTASPGAKLSLGTDLANTKLALNDDPVDRYGLGLQSFQFRLHLGNVNARFSFLNSAAGTELVSIQGTGNVGIGTTSPSQKLDVAGTAQMTGFKMPTGASNGFVLTSDASGVGTWQAAAGGGSFVNLQGSTPGSQQTGHLNISGSGLFGGKVGIGTSSPTKKLEVAGSIKVGTNDTIFSSNISSNSPLSLQAPAGSTRMFINDANGNVGIGTASPGAKLSLGTDLANTKLALNDDPVDRYGLGLQSFQFRLHLGNVNARFSFLSSAAGTELVSIQGTGNVGIGTASPDSKLDVRGQIIASGPSGPGYRAFAANGSVGGVTKFGATSGGGQSRGALAIQTNDADRIYVDVNGNVGVGTTTPQSKLQVVDNYMQIPFTTSAPPATDCDEAGEAGRLIIYKDGFGNIFLYYCGGVDGWRGLIP